MTSRAAQTQIPRQIEPVYVVLSGETLLNAPIETAWRHMINYPSWQHYSTVQHIAGIPGQEGEVVRLQKAEKGFAFPAYFARTIRLDAPRRVIWKTYLEKGTEEVDRFGIVEFRLVEAKGGTRFIYSLIYEFQVPFRHESELENFSKQQYANFAALLAVTHPKLKALVEADS
jgi:hypothetical protein